MNLYGHVQGLIQLKGQSRCLLPGRGRRNQAHAIRYTIFDNERNLGDLADNCSKKQFARLQNFTALFYSQKQ